MTCASFNCTASLPGRDDRLAARSLAVSRSPPTLSLVLRARLISRLSGVARTTSDHSLAGRMTSMFSGPDPPFLARLSTIARLIAP